MSSSLKLGKMLDWLEERDEHRRFNKIKYIFPEHGPYRKELYPKHNIFERATKDFFQVCFLAGNQTGKTTKALQMDTVWATGDYPENWEGKVFKRPVRILIAGKSHKSVKRVIQTALLGLPGAYGTGLIPKDRIIKTISKPGIPGAVQTIVVRSDYGAEGEYSYIDLMAYEQGREEFQGFVCDVVHFDEEPRDFGIYTESLTRMVTVDDSIALVTFTPLLGMSGVVLEFMPSGVIPDDGVNGSKFIVSCSWDDVPHLSAQKKAQLLEEYPPHERDARTKGIPSLGAGQVYPIKEAEFVCEYVAIQSDWRRAFAFDFGHKRNAGLWAAQDPNTKVIYIYEEFVKGPSEIAVLAAGLKSRGDWIPGVGDCLTIVDREKGPLLQQFSDLGVPMCMAQRKTDAQITKVFNGLSSGQIRISRSCFETLKEYRTYHRDDKGKIVKNDHVRVDLMDCLKYLIWHFDDIAISMTDYINNHGNFGGGSGYNCYTGWSNTKHAVN